MSNSIKTPQQVIEEHSANVQALFNKSRPLIPGNINDKTAWNLCDLCIRYGLDPVSGDVAWLTGGIPYVTFRGMTRIAHHTGLFNGVTVEIIHMDHETAQYIVKAKVYRTGAENPFEDFGDGETSNKQVGKLGKLKIATTRAKCRALRSAFPVELPVEGDSDEEMKDLLDRVGLKPDPANGDSITHPTPSPKPVSTNQTTQKKEHASNSKPATVGQITNTSTPTAPTAPTTIQSQPSTPDSAKSQSKYWDDAKKNLGDTMKEYQISGAKVKEVSMEMFGVDSSSALNADQLTRLAFVLREEHQGAQPRPTGPTAQPNRAP